MGGVEERGETRVRRRCLVKRYRPRTISGGCHEMRQSMLKALPIKPLSSSAVTPCGRYFKFSTLERKSAVYL